MRRAIIFTLALTLLLGGRAALSLLSQQGEKRPFVWQGREDCRAVDRYPGQWEPSFPEADHEVDLTLSCPEGVVGIHVAQYFGQQPGKEAVGPDHRFVSVQEGRGLSGAAVPTLLGFDANEFHHRNAHGDSLLIWQWYGIGDEAHAGRRRAKLAEAAQVLKLNPTSSTVFLVAAIGTGETEQAAGLVRQTAAALWQAYLKGLEP